MKNTLQKLDGLQQKIEALKAEQDQLKQQAAGQFIDVLEKQSALQLDFDALISCLLSGIEAIQRGDKTVEVWQAAGQKFRSHRSKTDPSMAKNRRTTQSTSDAKNSPTPSPKIATA